MASLLLAVTGLGWYGFQTVFLAQLLDGLLAGYIFEEDGPRYVGTDTAALAWRFGPPGKPIARG